MKMDRPALKRKSDKIKSTKLISIYLAYSPLCRVAANDHLGLKKFKALKDERPTSTPRFTAVVPTAEQHSSTTTAVNNGQPIETVTFDDSDECDVEMKLKDQSDRRELECP